MSTPKLTKQLEIWTTEFGKEYTDRNPATPDAMDAVMEAYYGGVKKSDIFRRFLSEDRIPTGRVLEVGCNVGAQLGILNSVNPKLELYGIDPQAYALSRAKAANPEFNFLPATAFDLPFKDSYFDAVMTNDVLIHISPADLPDALAEIHRVSKRYIFCHEYFAEEVREVNYKGHEALLWKMNYMSQYLTQFPDLTVVDEHYLEYPDPDGGPALVDQISLLEKRTA
ncbi:MAG: methyltransferase domain-containing protein [Acidobacteriota bacterium]|nr:methyltransferase domain-containing protein [Acidobacteriota bacterium]